MIQRLQLLRNIGQFDSVDVPNHLTFGKTTLVYAENGRGKTTIAAILRSLASGDAKLITERKRLNADHGPHIVIQAPTTAIFQNGRWNRTYPDIAIFDDTFVSRNVCSGIEIGSEHRQNLHELIIGEEGVTLNEGLQRHVAKIEDHNRALSTKASRIPAAELHGLTVDAFCALEKIPDVEAKIDEAARAYSAAISSEAVANQSLFSDINLPPLDEEVLTALLSRDLATLESTAAQKIQKHFEMIGPSGERWVAQGMRLMEHAQEHGAGEYCPFCAQPTDRSEVVKAYRDYFSEEYSALKSDIDNALINLEATHGGRAGAGFERAVTEAKELRDFWDQFVKIDPYRPDTSAISRAWEAAKQAAETALKRKRNAPLDRIELKNDEHSALNTYEEVRSSFRVKIAELVSKNAEIGIVKERASGANTITLAAELGRLKAAQSRHTTGTSDLCDEYLAEKAAKKETETNREHARQALDTYRSAIFPAYQTAINKYLVRFNAGFRIQNVGSVNTRGGSSCTYTVLINNVAVGLSAPDGDPCFRNTLSAGDRNTLALAFFFAFLEQDARRDQKVVVIDDPMTSLDEHRSLTSIQEIGKLATQVLQVLVLSHSKSFLCELWGGSDRASRVALRLVRSGNGSIIAAWDVTRDLITEHDRRHAAVVAYIQGPTTLQGNAADDERFVASSLRPVLEAFIRVAYPEEFPPGALLGPFHDKCERRIANGTPILSRQDADELRDLLDYANKFHHETNLAYQTEHINDQQLLDFSRRTLQFASLR